MRTANNAHQYLREPPPVKPFPIKYSTSANRKSCGQSFFIGLPLLHDGEG
jgi:hypothetical protein